MKTAKDFANELRRNFGDRSGFELIEDDGIWEHMEWYVVERFEQAMRAAAEDMRERCEAIARKAQGQFNERANERDYETRHALRRCADTCAGIANMISALPAIGDGK